MKLNFVEEGDDGDVAEWCGREEEEEETAWDKGWGRRDRSWDNVPVQ
jgi:hypothetical protein